MDKIHSDSGEVLIKISPLIGTRAQAAATQIAPAPREQQPIPRNSKQTELSPIHDFMSKLLQPGVIETLKEYVRWQAAWREGRTRGMSFETALENIPGHAPLSINLDVTTACNYRCDHCVDMDILNTGIRYDHEKLKDSLSLLMDKGLKSVIIIGGGEPTAYPGFEDIVRHLKARDMKIGVVTNGSLMKKIKAVADVLGTGDWVRLSLDSGSNDIFRRMHKPGSEKCTLEWICEQIAPIKDINAEFQIGFSFIIVWNNCEANDMKIIENLHEIYPATELAKRSRFDYISLKPFLTRAESNNAEIVELVKEQENIRMVMSKIRDEIERAKTLENDSFKVIESTNLRVLENESYQNYTEQPHNCHMQYFRQVLSPLGVFNCPVYRHVPQALLGSKHAYAETGSFTETQKNTLRLIEAFDAAEECKEVTCLYNHANWFIEDLIRNPEKLDKLEAGEERRDYFL